jgi:ribosomal protein S18 acetylase RimI-like enzyme
MTTTTIEPTQPQSGLLPAAPRDVPWRGIGAPSAVRTATLADRQAVHATLTRAFEADPVARWAFPEPGSFADRFDGLLTYLGGRAFEYGTARVTADGLGAALWLPPGVGPDDASLLDHLMRSVPPLRLAATLEILGEMDTYHPSEPHWYLPFLGVDPAAQNGGRGSRLLEHHLRLCDLEGWTAHLESSNPANIPLYQRHGFRAVGRIQRGDSPPITAMTRRPKSPSHP